MKKELIKLDLFKLIVLIFLIIVLTILLCERPAALVSHGVESSVDTPQIAENDLEEENSAVQVPLLPKSNSFLKLDEENTGLLDAAGVLRYRLSEDNKAWVPLIPEDILEILPDDFKLTSDESNMWHILDGNGGVLYSFNPDVLDWDIAPEKITETQDVSQSGDGKEIVECEGAKPARLTTVGSHIKVVNALIPLRSSPDAESANYVLSLPKGTTLEIVNLPVCTRFLGGANLWWGVRTESGIEGWAAEASAINDVYYLQEVK